VYLTLLVCKSIASNSPKKDGFKIWKFFPQLFWRSLIFRSIESKSKVYKNPRNFCFMENKDKSIFDVNISSYEHRQVSLLTLYSDCTNGVPPMWLHHIWCKHIVHHQISPPPVTRVPFVYLETLEKLFEKIF